MLHLNSWRNAWLEHHLNPETGKHRLRFVNPNSAHRPIHGFACYEAVWGLSRRFYAVYGHNDRFVFQAGNERFDLTEGCTEIEFKALGWGAASRIVVKHDGAAIHHATFIHPLRTLSALDPTFDSLDAEVDHFFSFLSGNITEANWRNHVVALCTAAA